MAPRIEVRLLDTPIMMMDGRQVTFYLKKADALFFYMCVEKNCTRTHLSTLLWGDVPEQAARKNLRNALYAIKKSLGFDPFESPKKQILKLNSQVDFVIDTDRFLETGDTTLYKTSFLKGFSLKDSYEYDEWIDSMRSRFLNIYINRLNERFDALPAQDISGKEEIFNRYTSADPLDEQIYLKMMQSYRDAGLYLKGIRCYETLASMLDKELKVSPSEEASLLCRKILDECNRSDSEWSSPEADRPLIGRDKEMSLLDKALNELRLHKGKAIFITGEKGVGKSRLCDDFLERRAAEDIIVLKTECLEYEAVVPFKPWINLLAQALHYLKNSSGSILPGTADMITSCSSILGSMEGLDPKSREFFGSPGLRALNNRVQRLLTTISDHHPVIISIDNVSNMDALSADCLSTLIRHNRGNIMFLITCPPYMDHKWERFFGDHVSVSGVDTIRLSPFDMDDVYEYLTLSTEKDPVSRDLARSYYDQSKGNPLILSIMVGSANTSEGKDAIASAELLDAWLSLLTKYERMLLDIISLFDDHGNVESLSFITVIDPLEIADMIDRLICMDLLEEEKKEGNIFLRFKYRIMRDHVRSSMSLSRAHLYEAGIAEYLFP